MGSRRKAEKKVKVEGIWEVIRIEDVREKGNGARLKRNRVDVELEGGRENRRVLRTGKR